MRKYIYILAALVCLLVFAFPVSTHAQGGAISSQTFGPMGTPKAGVTVTVCASSATVTNNVCAPAENDANCCFTESTLSARLTPPPSGGTILSSGLGNYTVWAAPGLYHVSYSGPGVFPSDQLVPVACVPNASACTGTGTVSSVSAGGFAPLFTTNVATPTSTPAITNTAISQNANNFYAGPSGTAIDLVDFAISTATGTASPISISATPKQSGDLAMVFSVRDNTGNAPAFTPDVSWTASSLNGALQEYFYKNVSGTATATASGAIGSTSPNWAAALALFTARPGFTPTLTNQANIISGAFSSFTNQVIGFTPTAGRTLIIAIMSGQTSFNLGPVSLVSFTDSVGDVFAPLSYVINNSGQGTEIILLAATGIAGGATTFSGSLTSATCPGCGIANGIVSVFEVTNLAPVTPTFGPMTVRQIVGADLPRPTPVSVGGVFSKAAVANQFLNSVNLDGTIGAAQPSFTNLSGTIAAAQVPATTSNCTGNNFAQGLNAGLTPICAATSVPIQVFTNKNLGGNVSLTLNTLTTLDSITPTMPSSGGPWRVLVCYAYFPQAGSGTNGESYVTDGTVFFANGWNFATATGSAYTACGVSPATYANGATPTFTTKAENAGNQTVATTSAILGVASHMSVTALASN